jgi:hypothetical protein
VRARVIVAAALRAGALLATGAALQTGPTLRQRWSDLRQVADILDDARDEAARLTRLQRIDPYGLTVRTPDDYDCAIGEDGRVATQCTGGPWRISWEIVEERVEAPLGVPAEASLVAIATLDVDSFHGTLYESPTTFVFDGTRIDPVRGSLRLIVRASSPRLSWMMKIGLGRDPRVLAPTYAVPALAVLLSTTDAPGGLASSWPSREDRRLDANARQNYQTLADDSALGRWRSAATALVSPRVMAQRDSPRLAATLDGVSPSIPELIERRIAQRAALGDVNAFGDAVSLTGSLGLLDPARARDAAATLAPELRAASSPGLATSDAYLWFSYESSLVSTREHAGSPEAVSDFARWLTPMKPMLWGAQNIGTVARNHYDNPDVAELLARWFDPARAPDLDSDFTTMAELARKLAPKLPVMRSHALAMLRDTRSCGEVKTTTYPASSVSYDVHCGHGGWGSARAGDATYLPPLGQSVTTPVRVNDVYAERYSGRMPFVIYAPEAERDREIAKMITWVEAQTGPW